MVLYTEDQLRRAWISHLISLYLVETEQSIELGEYPDLEDFREIFEQELEENPEAI